MERKAKVTIFSLTGFILLLMVILPPFLRPAGDGYNFASYADQKRLPRMPTPQALDRLPDRTMTKIDGSTVNLATLWQDKPLVIEFGSKTCPIFIAGVPSMEDLAQEFGSDANFVFVYANEAHPGVLNGPLRDMETKVQRAAAISSETARQVLVDSLDGQLHRHLAAGPNSAYIIDRQGLIAYGNYWANPNTMRPILSHLRETNGYIDNAQARIYPGRAPDHLSPLQMIKMIGGIAFVGGPDALFDFLWNGMLQKKTGRSKASPANSSS